MTQDATSVDTLESVTQSQHLVKLTFVSPVQVDASDEQLASVTFMHAPSLMLMSAVQVPRVETSEIFSHLDRLMLMSAVQAASAVMPALVASEHSPSSMLVSAEHLAASAENLRR